MQLADLEENENYQPLSLPLTPNDFPPVPRYQVLKEFSDSNGKSGEIRLELGADGVWLQFDCECTDALPYCQAQCCALIGTALLPEELAKFDYPVDYSPQDSTPFTMQRGADGFCECLNRSNRTCTIYENRPHTCQSFHCTRGADMRGFKLSNRVTRQSVI